MHFHDPTITALLGQAVGDSFGQPFEYHPHAVALSERSLREARYLDAHDDCGASVSRSRTRGLYTDDTQQALTLLWIWDQIVERGNNPLDVGLTLGLFLRVSKAMAQADIPGHQFGVHRGTGRNFRDAISSENNAPDTAGLGAAMRIGPVATLIEDRGLILPWTVGVSWATTSNPIAQAAAALLAFEAWRLAHQQPRRAISIRALAGDVQDAWALVAEARAILDQDGEDQLVEFARKHTTEKFTTASSGFALTGVPWVLHAVEQATDFEDALRRAASSGGDTDTLCAMAGCLAALRFGRDSIPGWMLDGLVGREHLLDPSMWHPIRTETEMAALDHDLRTRLSGSTPKRRV